MSGLKTKKSDGFYQDYTPVGALIAGDVVVIDDLAFVATNDIAAGELGALTNHGVFVAPKDDQAAIAFAVGEPVYWDDTANLATSDAAAGANKLLGNCVIGLAAAAGDATVTVNLVG